MLVTCLTALGNQGMYVICPDVHINAGICVDMQAPMLVYMVQHGGILLPSTVEAGNFSDHPRTSDLNTSMLPKAEPYFLPGDYCTPILQ
jgi:hypothetical protein